MSCTKDSFHGLQHNDKRFEDEKVSLNVIICILKSYILV